MDSLLLLSKDKYYNLGNMHDAFNYKFSISH